ncbi:nucleotide sugar dehydrogenase [Pelagibacteraceae bacterium]|jgi:UDP-N-acetyl-D-galactosamine dehydrogenase|nr:nucleotide sugar dehydrogenase [Pelagibacteraceae bacterium]
MTKSKALKKKIAVIGLGYVGLPLAIAFGERYHALGYDLNKKRIDELKKRYDCNLEISKNDFIKSKFIEFSNKKDDLNNYEVFIITVPTPLKKNKTPDLKSLIHATIIAAKYIKKKSIIIYESTVYPGTTEEICLPLIEKISKLKVNRDFILGYSPERINPGDKVHTLKKITKIVSASNKFGLKEIKRIYQSIIKPKIYSVNSIKIAEAAKIIENTQRDLNIALMNELTEIFDKLEINIYEVLNAAKTKWNFLNFSPGLVGGHCIGVDPYYLTYKAKKIGLNPKIILAGRKVNDGMPEYILERIIKNLKEKKIKFNNLKFLILGATFKENCNDIRNSKSLELCEKISHKFKNVDMFDPYLKGNDFENYKFNLLKKIPNKKYEVVIIAVKHDFFVKMGLKKIQKLLKKNHVLYDVKNLLKKN